MVGQPLPKRTKRGSRSERKKNKRPFMVRKEIVQRKKGGKYAVLDDQCFEGVCNNINLIEFVEGEGWEFITMNVLYYNPGWAAEYLFRKAEQ